MILRDEDLAAGTGGILRRPGPPGPVATDSRRLQPGQWFLALSGDRFDGEAFLPHARTAGCAGAIGRAMPDGWDRGFIQVEDGLQALQDLARWVRHGFHGPVVAVTGSAGKTTTRAMIALALGQGEAQGRRIHVTEGNLNNHIGVPLTILEAPVDAGIWVIEMGMSGFGEIDLLQEIARPSVRVITNVGPAHLEGVGSLEGVARAKGELFLGALPGDVCVVNQDDPRVAALPIPEGVRVLRYGTSTEVDVRLTDALVDAQSLATRFRVETPGGGVVLGQIANPGLHLALDAAAAVAVAVALHEPVDHLGKRLSRYAPVGMRLRLEEGPLGMRFLNDAYNANPISMEASLRTLGALQGARRVALLGDMLELGGDEERAHDEILALALALPLELVALAGPRFLGAASRRAEPPGARLVLAPTAAELGLQVAPRLSAGDVVLAKGSRGMGMEQALQSIRTALSSH